MHCSSLFAQVYFEGGVDVVHSAYGLPIAPPEQSVQVVKYEPDSTSEFPYYTGSFNFSIKHPKNRPKVK